MITLQDLCLWMANLWMLIALLFPRCPALFLYVPISAHSCHVISSCFVHVSEINDYTCGPIHKHALWNVCLFFKVQDSLSSIPLKDHRALSTLLRDLLAPRKSHPVWVLVVTVQCQGKNANDFSTSWSQKLGTGELHWIFI